MKINVRKLSSPDRAMLRSTHSILNEPLVSVQDHRSKEGQVQPAGLTHGNLLSMPSMDVAHEEKSGLLSSTINLTNSIIGAGVLTLPSALNYFGWFVGSFALMFFGFVSGIAWYACRVVCINQTIPRFLLTPSAFSCYL